ncbi:hypothetical protein KPL70_012438 [Citrus sinensis]|nr:hypothetical protein KPL70_012438 [Citrus sinensis]
MMPAMKKLWKFRMISQLELRSLARSAYNRGEYETSKILWEAAMAVNSLYPDGWFALGAAALKAQDVEKALDGFTRAVQLDPDNGEAWNNIACLYALFFVIMSFHPLALYSLIW